MCIWSICGKRVKGRILCYARIYLREYIEFVYKCVIVNFGRFDFCRVRVLCVQEAQLVLSSETMYTYIVCLTQGEFGEGVLGVCVCEYDC